MFLLLLFRLCHIALGTGNGTASAAVRRYTTIPLFDAHRYNLSARFYTQIQLVYVSLTEFVICSGVFIIPYRPGSEDSSVRF